MIKLAALLVAVPSVVGFLAYVYTNMIAPVVVQATHIIK